MGCSFSFESLFLVGVFVVLSMLLMLLMILYAFLSSLNILLHFVSNTCDFHAAYRPWMSKYDCRRCSPELVGNLRILSDPEGTTLTFPLLIAKSKLRPMPRCDNVQKTFSHPSTTLFTGCKEADMDSLHSRVFHPRFCRSFPNPSVS